MPYTATEISKRDGAPIELYKFEGTYQNFFYTSAAYQIVFDGDTYLPQPMRRSAIDQGTQNDDTSEVTIELSVTSQLVTIYGFQIAPPELELTIFRYHTPTEFVRYWNGPVEGISVVRGTATIRVPSALGSALLAEVPNVYFQTPCNNVLYDDRCQVDPTAFTQATTISAIDGQSVTVTSIGTLDGILVGGEVKLASGERRVITAQTGNVLTINYPFALAAVGNAVELIVGCDLAWDGDCRIKFNNQIHHTGFMFIPTENVFQDGLEPAQGIVDNTCLAPTFEFEGWYYRVDLMLPGNTEGIGPGSLIIDIAGSTGTVNGGLQFVTDPTGDFPDNGSTRQYVRLSNEHVRMYATVDRGDPRELFIQMQQLGTGGLPGNPPYVNSATFRTWNGVSSGPLSTRQSLIFNPGDNSDGGNGLTNFARAGNFPARFYFGL